MHSHQQGGLKLSGYSIQTSSKREKVQGKPVVPTHAEVNFDSEGIYSIDIKPCEI